MNTNLVLLKNKPDFMLPVNNRVKISSIHLVPLNLGIFNVSSG